MACTVQKIHFLPHLESFMSKQKFEIKFFKNNPIEPPDGVLPICRLLFPNGGYCNGVCRAPWVKFQNCSLSKSITFTRGGAIIPIVQSIEKKALRKAPLEKSQGAKHK